VEKFLTRLKELRHEKGLSQTQMSKEIMVNPTTIAKWETGDRTPSLEMLIILAKFFGCTLGYLAGIED